MEEPLTAEPIDIKITNAGLECPCCYTNQTFFSSLYQKWRCTKCGLLFDVEDTYGYELTEKGVEDGSNTNPDYDIESVN